MNTLRQFVLQCDFFAHGTFQRYKQEESYRTLAGGITSLIIVLLFIIVFANLAINTFAQTIIVSTISTQYFDDPTYSQLESSPQKNFMFAIGISNVDLSSSQRYFDIVLTNRTTIQNGTTYKTSTVIPLKPCNISQWDTLNINLTKSYKTLGFQKWLCPPTGQIFPLQGKFTSETFKYAQIVVSKCSNSSLYPNTTCQSSASISSFLAANGQFTFNFYFINPVLNPGAKNFISYYLEDSNYFSFDTVTGVSANLFYSDYSITTDTTILPIQILEEVDGLYTSQTAVGQSYQIQPSTNQYFKLFIRKAASQMQSSRSFQKMDQSLSFVGGLFGAIILLLLPLNIYSKYLYELEIGNHIFKQNNGGAFGVQNFNFIVFIGYILYLFSRKLGICRNWQSMKIYQKCQTESRKQLSIDLLFKKITHFEQMSKLVLQNRESKMLMMVPKPTIKEAKLNRKRYFIKSYIYHQLERKGRDVFVSKEEFKNRLQNFLAEEGNQNIKDMVENQSDQSSLNIVKGKKVKNYKKKCYANKSDGRQSKNNKMQNRITVKDMANSIFSFIRPKINQQSNHQVNQTEEAINQNVVKVFPIYNQPFQFSDLDEHDKNQLSDIELKSKHKMNEEI